MNDKKTLTAIWRVYLSGIVIYLALLLLSIFAMNSSSFQLTTNYWTSNALTSQTTTVFAQGTRVITNIEFRWALVVLLAISIIVPAYYVYLIKNNYKKIDLEKYKMVDFAITGSLILLLISILSSVQDIMTLVLVTGISLIGYVLLWQAIHSFKKDSKNSGRIYLLSIVCFGLIALLILVYSIGTIVYGNVRSPWFVYALDLVIIIKIIAYSAGLSWYKKPAPKNLTVPREVYPIIFNQVIKVAFALILILGLKR